jgi:hypothetical protein
MFQQTPVSTADAHSCSPANWNPLPLPAGSGATGDEVQPSELDIGCLSHVCLAIANRLHMQYPNSAQAVISCLTDES